MKSISAALEKLTKSIEEKVPLVDFRGAHQAVLDVNLSDDLTKAEELSRSISHNEEFLSHHGQNHMLKRHYSINRPS